ncbi:SDR family oxidoreductase [Streptomyces sp. NPDC001480]|uniref:SDR family oxidoreductase n=1 Tax=Streptomyces sp. NPDC001480 TaxID=3364577 RepID=UPI003686490E
MRPLAELYKLSQDRWEIRLRARIPGARRTAATPRGIAAVIAYLAGDAASFVHGVALPVDGGRTAV